MADRPRTRKTDRSIVDQGGTTPIRALTAVVLNRRAKKADKKYQAAQKKSGRTVNGGGRSNVLPAFKGTF